MDVPIWTWAAFVAFILAMLAVDLRLHRDDHVIRAREAAGWSAIWIALGLSFGALLWAWQGSVVAGEYLAGYLIEKSLSVDNIFVFALLLSYFSVPARLQHRVLFWGVMGALVMRAIFIAGGAALLNNFEWMIFVFGAFLVFTGLRMATHRTAEVHPERNPVLRLVRRAIPMTADYQGGAFFVRQAGKKIATPLLAVLIAIETTDVIFAVDSIPAIFAVTREPFIVFTSNAFAILGLRALYFLLAGIMTKFKYLSIGLSAVLVFVGAKMIASEWYHIPITLSLGVIAVLIGGSMGISMLYRPTPEEQMIDAEIARKATPPPVE